MSVSNCEWTLGLCCVLTSSELASLTVVLSAVVALVDASDGESMEEGVSSELESERNELPCCSRWGVVSRCCCC